jgi:hypothetical protein
MPRSMSPAREREYAELRGYLNFFATHVWGIDPASPIHPTNVGDAAVDLIGRSKALEGLRQAVNDTMEVLRHQPLAYIQKLDAALSDAKLLTSSEVRRRYASAYGRLLKRGRISNETEYYLVAGILSDGSSQATSEERAKLEVLAATYLGDA